MIYELRVKKQMEYMDTITITKIHLKKDNLSIEKHIQHNIDQVWFIWIFKNNNIPEPWLYLDFECKETTQ